MRGVGGPHGLSGLDNGYNLLETAFAPVNGGAGGLRRLAEAVRRELRDTQLALAAEGAMLINAAEHPAASLDADWYRRVRVPRPIYEELVGQRGWLHRIGIDAKAQNSPCTSVPVAIAARCLNVVLALAPAQIAMFANSPLEAGRVTGLKENRLTLWPRMFRGARYLGDDLLHRLPARPFRDLGDYFRWMFGGLTASRALPPGDACDYKNADVACLVGAPSLAEFLYAGAWSARNLNDGGSVRLAARSEHFVYSQFAQFLDARWRYRMPIVPALPALLRAWDRRAAWKRCSSRPARKATSRGACRARYLPMPTC
ncbi:Glutamate-cysteine ligase family 2(GCS2) [Bordetella pertussis]|nr:Glutamate-cysteine ligase family 2(GCS2) [Bordetella pertussis]